MEVELQSQLAFHLTGRRPGADLCAVDPLALRPALLARYRDLTTLRYDFPVALVEDAPGDTYVQALSGIVDSILQEIAQDDDGERVTRHVLRLEQQIRALMAEGTKGSLSALWETAAGRLGVRADALLADSLARARAALKVDGELLDCDVALPYRLVKHAWSAVQDQKADSFRDNISRLVQKLSDILVVDFARSEDGRSPESLEASVGALHADAFDFGALSRVLGKTSAEAALPAARRQRIRVLLSVLGSQRFYPRPVGSGSAVPPYSFVFDSCTGALAAYRERNPELVALAKAIAMAELEIAGEFRESKHEAFFDGFGEDGLDPKELAVFPDYLVRVNAHKLDAAENSTLMEILSEGLPIKILVQVDDIPSALRNGEDRFEFSMGNHVATMAIGFNAVYVMQSCSANLFQFRDRLRAGFSYAGPALFSVFSGATPSAENLPPYLTAAAAMESRAFPAFSYDPSAGPDWASRFDLQANPQAELDWPVHRFEYQDESHQMVTDNIAFTLVDFLACDRRYARHLARVPRSRWSANMVPAGECVARAATGSSNEVPCLLVVDRENTLHKIIVDDKMMREARRCRDMWRSLQELGGIHNSHAERLLARERNARAEEERGEGAAHERERSSSMATPTAIAAPSDAPSEKPSDDAYIETARCTTCNECTKINDKMFNYNENQQAYIANAAAGTYAQLVEAAESCQVAIIHPGKPRDPNEPDLEELMRRAEPFR